MKTDLRKRWQFFFQHAGWSTPPGKAACALDVAKAELYAEAQAWSVEWEWDNDADWSWMDERERKQAHEVYSAILYDADHTAIGSLSGIFDPDNNYRRCVEADLACEAMRDSERQHAHYAAVLKASI